MSMNGRSGLANVTVGGNVYPLVSAPGCKTCGSEYRMEIEAGLVKGSSPNQVIKHLPEGHGLVERNLRDHLAAGHLPLKSAAVQKLAQEESEERSRVVEAGAEVLSTHAAFARTVVGRVRERVANGEIEPDIRDALAATKLLYEFESEPSGLNQDNLVAAMVQFMRVVKGIVTPDQFAELGRQVNSDPLLNALREGTGGCS
ncbi:MAG: hypothetical protein LC749_04625 [Actinobacteria bacterium]|nr:hypothetical protein [Actinomycetota bacterium]